MYTKTVFKEKVNILLTYIVSFKIVYKYLQTNLDTFFTDCTVSKS